MNGDKIRPQHGIFFPGLLAGLPFRTAIYGRNFTIATWHFMISGRTFLEDAEGAIGSPEYMLMLKIGLAEVLFSADCLLKGAEAPDELHRIAMFMELGLSEVARMSATEAIHALALDRNTGNEEEFRAVEEFWLALQAGFPADLPDPLLPGSGQRELINTLRNWSGFFKQNNIDGSFLAELYKSL